MVKLIFHPIFSHKIIHITFSLFLFLNSLYNIDNIESKLGKTCLLAVKFGEIFFCMMNSPSLIITFLKILIDLIFKAVLGYRKIEKIAQKVLIYPALLLLLFQDMAHL